MKTIFDRAYGAVLGSAIGDAMGATLEFYGTTITQRDVKNAMSLPGGGVFKVAKGQVTDDTELTLAMFNGIIDYITGTNNSKVINTELLQKCLAKRYYEWFCSKPFDIGNTTSNSFTGINDTDTDIQIRDKMVGNAENLNFKSLSNGSLMRCVPLAILSVNIKNITEVNRLVNCDVSLFHSNIIVQEAITTYVFILSRIINGTFDNTTILNVKEWLMDKKSDSIKMLVDNALFQKFPNYSPNIGYFAIAFSRAIYYSTLKESEIDYNTIIEKVLLGGGDTDTNSAIIGAILGSIKGYKLLPEKQMKMVITCKTKHSRPNRYHPICLESNVRTILSVEIDRIF